MVVQEEKKKKRGSMMIPDFAMGLFKYLFRKKEEQEIIYEEKTVKILCMGKQGVGKTSVIQKLCCKEHFIEEYFPTLYEDRLKNMIVDEYDVTMQFMDMGGSQSFPSMQEVFIRQADIYILFYAVDDVESFNKMIEYRDKIASIKQKHTTQLPLIVVRNKVDLKQKRLRKEVNRRKTINQWCGKIYDVSAKTGLKINAVMDSLIEESKFIGNKIDLGDVKVSGRYVYEDSNKKHTEVYHKAPNVFREPDNSDEKMEKRRRRSVQHHTRKMSRATTRRHSFSSMNAFRRISRAQPPNKENLDAKNDETKDSSGADIIESKDAKATTSILKSNSKDSILNNSTNNSPKPAKYGSKPNSPKLVATAKRNVFKMSGKNDSFDEVTTESPKPFRRLRRKSVSTSDLRSPFARLRSCSMESPKVEKLRKPTNVRQRSISVVQRPKASKIDIVHTTLRERLSSDGNVPVVSQRFRGQSVSVLSKECSTKTIPKPKISTGRRLSTSIDTISDAESGDEGDVRPPPLKTMSLGRRRSLSQNDLSTNLAPFQRSISSNPGPAYMGKKRISVSSKISENVATLISASPGINQRRNLPTKKKVSMDSEMLLPTTPENDLETDEPLSAPRRRKMSVSNPDLLSIRESMRDDSDEISSSLDEKKNSFSLLTKSKRRPPLQKGESMDSGSSTPLMKVKQFLTSATSIGST